MRGQTLPVATDRRRRLLRWGPVPRPWSRRPGWCPRRWVSARAAACSWPPQSSSDDLPFCLSLVDVQANVPDQSDLPIPPAPRPASQLGV